MVAFVIFGSNLAFADELKLYAPKLAVTNPTFEYKADTEGTGGLIVGGTVTQDMSQWPASLMLTTKVGSGEEMCSATLVGPDTLLTAAHCVEDNSSISLGYKKQHPKGTCNRSPSYVEPGIGKVHGGDIALCKFAPPLTGILFESVSLKSDSVVSGRTILLSGFGCDRNSSSHGAREFRTGVATISTAPTLESPEYEGFVVVNGKASLCLGDSGGSAYQTAQDDVGQRVVVGVNAAVFLDGSNRSVFTALSSPEVSAWIQAWSVSAHICGINADTGSCKKSQW